MNLTIISRFVFALATCLLAREASAWTMEGRALAIDADTIDIDGVVRVRLFGIDAPEIGQDCNRSGGGVWKCGIVARDRLSELVDGRSVACAGESEDDYGRLLGRCSVGGAEINSLLVSEGLAWAFVRYADDYAALESEARTAGVGVWQAPTQTPWDYRAAKWLVGEQEAPAGCPIKGNINREGERIYHAPWSPWYGRTKVSVEKGERWFCSEAEAIAAGWRAPYWSR